MKISQVNHKRATVIAMLRMDDPSKESMDYLRISRKRHKVMRQHRWRDPWCLLVCRLRGVAWRVCPTCWCSCAADRDCKTCGTPWRIAEILDRQRDERYGR